MVILGKTTSGERIFLIFVLMVAGFLRLYRINETLMFLGDQGRDAIVAKRMLIDHDLTLIGPVTSVGNMYLGPFYYYFMVPWLALTYPNPVGPAMGVAVSGVATVFLVYLATKKMFDQRAAMTATILYSFSSVAVHYSRFSWNPNLAPFFGLLVIYWLYRAVGRQEYRFWPYTLLAFGLLIQLHYTGLLVLPVIVTFLGFELWRSQKRSQLVGRLVLGMVVLIVVSLPLIIFDVRHNFINYQALQDFVNSPQGHLRGVQKVGLVLRELEGRSYRILPQLMGSRYPLSDRLILLGMIGVTVWSWFSAAKRPLKRLAVGIIVVWLAMAILGTSFYNSGVFDHYLGFVFPAPFILSGVCLAKLWRRHWLLKPLVASIIGIFIVVNLRVMPIWQPASPPVTAYADAAKTILGLVGPGAKYNITLLSDTRDYKAMNYRYFLEVGSHPPASAEDYDKLDELYVIMEPPYTDPLSLDIYEIQRPGLTRTELGVNLYGQIRLVRLVR
ncbi:hypothetical protein A3A66_00465 [Microgenomates group bacterium RIFCSPLOWO2_01_FULL_46_13]|nr:MAG: hypothetical protein A2783_03990 [Microgenomates group bacterium RIFCSPHIGHO2_01_FULL_45_11]OGV94486.1 MAG: hypothetical protein A3A66_00465 [Microgenomates group bacterium RIFCSPLOWO2_01_FULL_46_13]